MRVTEKGQVTIPKPIRDRLRIGPGSEVDFVQRPDGGVELVKGGSGGARGESLSKDVEDWFRLVEGTGDSGLSADDIMTMTRDRNDRDGR